MDIIEVSNWVKGINVGNIDRVIEIIYYSIVRTGHVAMGTN